MPDSYYVLKEINDIERYVLRHSIYTKLLTWNLGDKYREKGHFIILFPSVLFLI